MSVYFMGSVQDLPQESKAEVEQYLGLGVPNFEAAGGAPECHCVTLGTVQEGGVRLTVINLLKNPNLNELFMQCNAQSQKVKNVLACGRAEVAITNGMGYLVLTCKAEVLTDGQAKADRWEDWMAEYHPQGCTAPDYVLLRFVPERIRVMC